MTKTNETLQQKRAFPWRNLGIFFSTFALLVFIGAFVYGYTQLSKINVSLAQTLSDLKDRSDRTEGDVTTLQNDLTHFQQTQKEIENRTLKQEQLLTEWRAVEKGDLNKWQTLEAHYLVKLANDTLQFTYQYKPAYLLLQRADQLLGNLEDATLLEIRKSLATDMTRLQALPEVDITTLFLQLTALNIQLDHLPLPVKPLQTETKNPPKSSDASSGSGWKSAWNQTLQGLSKIVIVRKNAENGLPLVMPEEKTFLYQNLHAQLESAKWALLHRDQSIYQTSLARALVWIHQYFDQNASETKSMIDNITALLKINIQPAELNLTNTLQLFDKYFAQIQASG